MSGGKTRLSLITPRGVGPAEAGAIEAALAAACAEGDVAAVILRLAADDERGLINLVKRLAPGAQAHGAALVVEIPASAADPVTVAARGGADGVHVERADAPALRDLRGQLREARILGCGGVLGSKHAAMDAGEAGVDYLMFGGRFPDGAMPDPERVRERAAWWAEIFETPCIAVAATADEVGPLAATGAEFVGLEGSLWLEDPQVVRAAQAVLDATRGGPR